jgi:uncharacterized membrane protein (UPF0182 family)
MGETLDQALDAMFGDGQSISVTGQQADTAGQGELSAATKAATAAAPTGNMASLLQQAQTHYDRAIAAQRAGDWAAYGKEIDALGAVLNQLRTKRQ